MPATLAPTVAWRNAAGIVALLWLVLGVGFTIVSLIFVYGRRSLTPGLVAHAMTHVLGDPVLIQGILRGVAALS